MQAIWMGATKVAVAVITSNLGIESTPVLAINTIAT